MSHQFAWVWRHYDFEGQRLVVTRAFKDTVIVQPIIGRMDRGPERTVPKQEFLATARLIDGDPWS